MWVCCVCLCVLCVCVCVCVCVYVCAGACATNIRRQLHGADFHVPPTNMSLAAGSTYDLSSLVAAAPQQVHISAQIGFTVDQGKAGVSFDLLGGHAAGGYERVCVSVCLSVCVWV